MFEDIEEQKLLIHKWDWDVLIILDSCRFDYFEHKYGNFMGGQIKKVQSSASDTFSWLQSVFQEYYDCTVYSSHPVLNSKGVPRGGYKAAPHFKRIVDVWKDKWSDKFGTVLPQSINQSVFEDMDAGLWGGKNIIWYMQPHAPWIGRTKISGFAKTSNDKMSLIKIWEQIKRGKIDKYKLRRAYKDNIIVVMEQVRKLVPHLKGKIIITADHGESLGEEDRFGHSAFTMVRELVMVPWLEINL